MSQKKSHLTISGVYAKTNNKILRESKELISLPFLCTLTRAGVTRSLIKTGNTQFCCSILWERVKLIIEIKNVTLNQSNDSIEFQGKITNSTDYRFLEREVTGYYDHNTIIEKQEFHWSTVSRPQEMLIYLV